MDVSFVGADLSQSDIAELERRGINHTEAARQLRLLRTAPPPVALDRPCTVGDGIVALAAEQHAHLLATAEQAIGGARVMKFVPASGAATRMFKDLIGALTDGESSSAADAVTRFVERMDDFPFAGELRARAGVHGPVTSTADQRRILRTMLSEMGYAELPKALIPFHRGGDVIRTAFEEQLLETVQYTAATDGIARVHFTVAPEFRAAFERLLAEVAPRVEAVTPGVTLSVSFSEQHPSTDTLAATPEGDPFRLADGSLLFRPAGHGALLGNLQATAGDLVVIKNIDNVVPFEASGDVVRWKRLLIGYAATLHREVCERLAACTPDAANAVLDRAIAYAASRFGRAPEAVLPDRGAKRRFVSEALSRPLRVCGVVKNEGEPGGAPFWIIEPDGRRSAQIVEASQIDLSDTEQHRVFSSSTHFNPVDLVCAVRACDGTPFDLAAFVDPDAVFLSQKSFEGRDLIALERPGLWNGAMAYWNTVFVEVPATTFAPVKTVFDLLRPEHQSL